MFICKVKYKSIVFGCDDWFKNNIYNINYNINSNIYNINNNILILIIILNLFHSSFYNFYFLKSNL
jgi:hypothetical protein